jgi:hypothetical protein
VVSWLRRRKQRREFERQWDAAMSRCRAAVLQSLIASGQLRLTRVDFPVYVRGWGQL